MSSIFLHQSTSTNLSQWGRNSPVVAFTGSICLQMTDFGSLYKCANTNANSFDSFRFFAVKLFLYEMQLLFIKNITIKYYKAFNPKDFAKPDNRSILGAQYFGEIDYAMSQTVVTFQRSQLVTFSTPFKFGYLCFYVRRPEIQKKKTTSK